MDVVLVGLPGSGKSVVGRRLAAPPRRGVRRPRRADRARGRPVASRRSSRRRARRRSGRSSARRSPTSARPTRRPSVRRVIATGGGAVVDPRNRWALYRGRTTVWLDGRPEVLAQRLRRSPHVRPLVAGRDPIGTLRDLGGTARAVLRRRRHPTSRRRRGRTGVVDAVEAPAAADRARPARRRRCCGPSTPIGRHRARRRDRRPTALAAALRRARGRAGDPRLRARRLGAPSASALADGLRARRPRGRARSCCPRARRPSAWRSSRTRRASWPRLRVERREPLVAIGGGALGDAAGFLAATYLRGVPVIHVPTTLVAQIDSSIGGKTGVDLPEGKNLVGAFHQPAAVVIDIAVLRTLPERQRRAALGEAVKMAALGDERLFELLERDGAAIAARRRTASSSRAPSPSSSSGRPGRRSRSSLADERERGATAAGSR